MSTHDERLANLLAWLRSNGVFLHPKLRIVRDGTRDATTVYATGSIYEPRTTVVRLPKRLLLSPRTSSLELSSEISSQPEVSATVHLTLCTMHEFLLRDDSPWAPYLASLPKEVPIALLWPEDGEHRRWVQATELDKILIEAASDSQIKTREGLERWYRDHRALLPPSFPTSTDFFLRCYALVSSRAFIADAYHGVSLAPLLDLFDHHETSDVQVETDHWVCPTCGKLWGCAHDNDDADERDAINPKVKTSDGKEEEEDDNTLDLVSTKPILKGDEVHNSYGPNLSSAYLVAHYGYIPSFNSNDHLRFDMREVAAVLRRRHQDFDEFCRVLEPHALADTLENWYWWCEENVRPRSAMDLIGGFPQGDNFALIIDGDASLSPLLFLLLRPDQDTNPLRELLEARLAKTHRRDLSTTELYELVDKQTDVNTRMAIELLAGERSLLEDYVELWEDLEYDDEDMDEVSDNESSAPT